MRKERTIAPVTAEICREQIRTGEISAVSVGLCRILLLVQLYTYSSKYEPVHVLQLYPHSSTPFSALLILSYLEAQQWPLCEEVGGLWAKRWSED